MPKKLSGTALQIVKKKIQAGALPDEELKELLEAGRLDADELINEGIITQEKYDELFYVSPEQRKEEIRQGFREGRYDDHDIEQIVFEGIFSAQQLVDEGLITLEKKRELFPEVVKVEFGDWVNIPEPRPNRVDIFTLGVAGSGKSCLLGGLLYHIDLIGHLRTHIDNTSGYEYASTLIETISEGNLISATSVDHIQYMECDITDDDKEVHPLTFIEMSGEVFEGCMLKQMDEIPEKFRKFFFDNPNNKYIFLAADYKASSHYQKKQFDYILQFCEKHGMLETVEGIALIVTKWDRAGNADVDGALKEFLDKNYLSFMNLCEGYSEKYGLKFYRFRYSLGQFNEKDTSYTFDGSFSEKIYQLLSTTSIDPKLKMNKKKRSSSKTKKGSWWRFGR